jgi:hypothetical protein
MCFAEITSIRTIEWIVNNVRAISLPLAEEIADA